MSETAMQKLRRLADEQEAAGKVHTAAAMRKSLTDEDEAASFLLMMGLAGEAARSIRGKAGAA